MSVDESDQPALERTTPRSLCLLHIMAGCKLPVSLDTAKYLLDSGQCGVNDHEPHDLLTPLHVAASWDNLVMCQLLVHYGADLLAMNRDNCTPSDVAKGNSKEFLSRLMKRSERKRTRRIFKFLRFLFQPHQAKKQTPTIRKAASTQCIPSPRQPTIDQQIEDFLQNADVYNARLSSKRFSGLSTIGHSAAQELINIMGNSNSQAASVHERNSSLSSYRTANDEINAPPTTSDQTPKNHNTIPMPSIFPSLYPSDELSKLDRNLETIGERSPELTPRRMQMPTAPPLTPNITMRKAKTPKSSIDRNADVNKTPTPLPRSISLTSALVPKDITPTTTRVSDVSEASEPEDPVMTDLIEKAAHLSLNQLKSRLSSHQFSPGPLDNSNRRAYEKKLAVLEYNALKGVEYEMKGKSAGFKYSIALERMIRADEDFDGTSVGQLLEDIIRAEFNDRPTRDDISFFCYLLIDITNLLPCPPFLDFIRAIFYIGKGKRSRPLCHFADTIKHRQNPKGQPSNKIKHISTLWDKGMGVVSLHLFNNIHAAEALIREGAMIDAIGVDILDNLQRGTFSGAAKKWSRAQIAEYGAFLLRKAYNIYLNERCRPIFEKDITDLKLW